jgi:hypothetical protein
MMRWQRICRTFEQDIVLLIQTPVFLIAFKVLIHLEQPQLACRKKERRKESKSPTPKSTAPTQIYTHLAFATQDTLFTGSGLPGRVSRMLGPPIQSWSCWRHYQWGRDEKRQAICRCEADVNACWYSSLIMLNLKDSDRQSPITFIMRNFGKAATVGGNALDDWTVLLNLCRIVSSPREMHAKQPKALAKVILEQHNGHCDSFQNVR